MLNFQPQKYSLPPCAPVKFICCECSREYTTPSFQYGSIGELLRLARHAAREEGWETSLSTPDSTCPECVNKRRSTSDAG